MHYRKFLLPLTIATTFAIGYYLDDIKRYFEPRARESYQETPRHALDAVHDNIARQNEIETARKDLLEFMRSPAYVPFSFSKEIKNSEFQDVERKYDSEVLSEALKPLGMIRPGTNGTMTTFGEYAAEKNMTPVQVIRELMSRADIRAFSPFVDEYKKTHKEYPDELPDEELMWTSHYKFIGDHVISSGDYERAARMYRNFIICSFIDGDTSLLRSTSNDGYSYYSRLIPSDFKLPECAAFSANIPEYLQCLSSKAPHAVKREHRRAVRKTAIFVKMILNDPRKDLQEKSDSMKRLTETAGNDIMSAVLDLTFDSNGKPFSAVTAGNFTVRIKDLYNGYVLE